MQAIAPLAADASAAVAKRAQAAMRVLAEPGGSLPCSWIKTWTKRRRQSRQSAGRRVGLHSVSRQALAARRAGLGR
jgi:hypothetical protein